MITRFAEVDENGIQDLVVSSENENSRKSTKYSLKVFQKWAAAWEVEESAQRILTLMS